MSALSELWPQSIWQAQQRSPLPLLEQHMLWQHVLGVERSWLIAHDRDPLTPTAWQHYQQLEQRRMAGVPMAYLLGWREFMGHRFMVSPAVLIPRPETELLVEHVLQQVLPCYAQPRVLDLGTGSGVIAVSLACAYPAAQLMATDLSAAALEVAQQNARTLCDGKVEFLKGSWYDCLDEAQRFDVIVSNPPYIAADDAHLLQGDLRQEPQQALTDGQDGMNDLRTIISQAPRFLHSGGQLWVEHGWNQACHVRELLLEAKFSEVRSICDLAGVERISGGTLNF